MKRMTIIFLYQSETESLAGLLKPHFSVRQIALREELEHALPVARRAVVVFSPENPEPARIQAQLTQLKTLLSPLACVVLLKELPADGSNLLELDASYIAAGQPDFLTLSQIAAAVRQAELLATLDDCNHLDEVTNLYHRNYFIKRLSEEISLSRRHLSPLSCVIIGINFYKMYLDSYGYDFINRLLAQTAKEVEKHTRHEDLIARTGDDEVAILLPRSSEKGAKIVTHRIVEQLNKMTISHGTGEERIGVHAGVAGYPLPDGEKADADTIIRYARHALHNARCNKREKVLVQLFSEIQPAL